MDTNPVITSRITVLSMPFNYQKFGYLFVSRTRIYVNLSASRPETGFPHSSRLECYPTGIPNPASPTPASYHTSSIIDLIARGVTLTPHSSDSTLGPSYTPEHP